MPAANGRRKSFNPPDAAPAGTPGVIQRVQAVPHLPTAFTAVNTSTNKPRHSLPAPSSAGPSAPYPPTPHSSYRPPPTDWRFHPRETKSTLITEKIFELQRQLKDMDDARIDALNVLLDLFFAASNVPGAFGSAGGEGGSYPVVSTRRVLPPAPVPTAREGEGGRVNGYRIEGEGVRLPPIAPMVAASEGGEGPQGKKRKLESQSAPESPLSEPHGALSRMTADSEAERVQQTPLRNGEAPPQPQQEGEPGNDTMADILFRTAETALTTPTATIKAESPTSSPAAKRRGTNPSHSSITGERFSEQARTGRRPDERDLQGVLLREGLNLEEYSSPKTWTRARSWMAIEIARKGEVMERPCERCSLGRGIFRECRRWRGGLCCANCTFTTSPGRCEAS